MNLGLHLDESQTSRKGFLTEFCLPALLRSQNSDGGWGFREGSESAIEPTAWALIALEGQRQPEEVRERVLRGGEFLLDSQLADGSWPAFPKLAEGCWVTSLACLALWPHDLGQDSALDGAHWLCHQMPGEGKWNWRLRHQLFDHEDAASQNHSLYGWPWTTGTASWVEPTAFALLALGCIPTPLLPAAAAKRRELGVVMLVDRKCPGGGWNCGNPMVYGAVGRPLVGPTVWALLALRNSEAHTAVAESLDWIVTQAASHSSMESLALSEVCLKSFGSAHTSIEQEFRRRYETDNSSWSVPILAWCILSLHASSARAFAARA